MQCVQLHYKIQQMIMLCAPFTANLSVTLELEG